MNSILVVIFVGLIGASSCYPVMYGNNELIRIRRVPKQYYQQPMMYSSEERPLEYPVVERSYELEPLMSSDSMKEPMTAETGHSSPYEYVDYGAYTGGYGAFGWYSDHPVQTY